MAKFEAIVVSLGLLLGSSVAQEASQPVQSAPAATQSNTAPAAAVNFEITGVVKSGNTPLPGVTITAAHSLTGKKVASSTELDGSFRLLRLATFSGSSC
jgi:3',5'-cyclic AMP phosphodiesterase CpdA